VLAHAVSVARDVPAFALTVARDQARLDDAAATIVAWHADVEARATASVA
jgi:hypothetical protein